MIHISVLLPNFLVVVKFGTNCINKKRKKKRTEGKLKRNENTHMEHKFKAGTLILVIKGK